jgi:uncharacterized protein YndB with AHSA1/START domain
VLIEAQPDRVWGVYVDPLRIPEWQTGSPVIEEVRGAGGVVGSTYVSRRGPGAASTTVIEADRPHRLVTATDAYLGLRLKVASRIEGTAEGTRIELQVETHWPRGLRVLGRLIEFAILSRREAGKELANLKALVEREAKAGSGPNFP